MTSPAKKLKTTTNETPYLPPELVGKIIGLAGLPYTPDRINPIGLSRDQRAYANIALRQVEQEWSPMVQVVKETLTRLQNHLMAPHVEGGANRFHPTYGEPHPSRLLTCWPRHWLFEDLGVADTDQLRSEIADARGSTMDTEMCDAIAGTLKYCFSTPRHWGGYEQDAKTLTVSFPKDRLHTTVASAWMEFDEALVDYYESYEGVVDTLEREFSINVRFVDGDQYKISVSPERSRHPDHYRIIPGWVLTHHFGNTFGRPRRTDKEKKGKIGSHAFQICMILRQLLLMEETRPFMFYDIGDLVETELEWKEEMRAVGLDRLGVPGLLY